MKMSSISIFLSVPRYDLSMPRRYEYNHEPPAAWSIAVPSYFDNDERSSENLPNWYDYEPLQCSSRTPTISGTGLDTTTACSDRLSDRGTCSRPDILVESSLVDTRELFDPFDTSRQPPVSSSAFDISTMAEAMRTSQPTANRSQLMSRTRLGEWLTQQPLSSYHLWTIGALLSVSYSVNLPSLQRSMSERNPGSQRARIASSRIRLPHRHKPATTSPQGSHLTMTETNVCGLGPSRLPPDPTTPS